MGMSMIAKQTLRTCVGQRGTWPYMAPEMYDATIAKTALADMWAVGVIIVEMVQRKPIYGGMKDAEIMGRVMGCGGRRPLGPPLRDLPQWCMEVCSPCFSINSANRLTAEAMSEVIASDMPCDEDHDVEDD